MEDGTSENNRRAKFYRLTTKGRKQLTHETTKWEKFAAMRGEGRTTSSVSRSRTRNSLVVAEIAVALVLAICAGLMINRLTRMLRTDPGFTTDHLVTAQVRLAGDKYELERSGPS